LVPAASRTAPAWSTTGVTPADPPSPPAPPRWLVVLLSAGVSVLLAGLFLLLLDAAGVERIGLLGFLLVLVAAAVAGGYLVRLVAPRLPAGGRRPRR
jgi:hypothetical protein